ITAQFCRQHGLAYCQTGLIDSYPQTLRHRHAVGPQPTAQHALNRTTRTP
ncbi:MAG: hypothetical protein JWP76_569, partial [Dactylosporangium sp.]|nr:hypothetical protein [Dactylosporangium sp.]